MRIRSIRPEFWTSEDIAALDIPTRLLFIGLWSYVDDNGVGRDVEKLIRAELFPLEDNPREALAIVSRGLQTLFSGGQITRYIVDEKPYLYITAWDKHQKVDRPGRERYPLPTRGDAAAREHVNGVSRESREGVSSGEGEKGRRGEGEKEHTSATADEVFAEFWAAYPLKRGKIAARKRWDALMKQRVDPLCVILGARAYAAEAETIEDKTKIKHPEGWLNAGRWEDEPLVPVPKVQGLYSPPPIPDDMPRDLFSKWNRAHFEAHQAGRPGPADWHELEHAS